MNNYHRELFYTYYDRYFDDALGYVEDTGWMLIGTADKRFIGTFNGNGHTIYDLKISRNADYQGLFGYVFQGEIHNVKLANAEVIAVSNHSIGSLAGLTERYATVSDVSASGVVSGYEYVRGLIGHNSGTLTRSSFNTTGEVITGYRFIGGLVGGNQGMITQSFALAELDSSGYAIGGLAGINADIGVIENSYARGNIFSAPNAGGLVGDHYGGITNTYASVSSPGYGLTNTGADGDVTSSYFDRAKA